MRTRNRFPNASFSNQVQGLPALIGGEAAPVPGGGGITTVWNDAQGVDLSPDGKVASGNGVDYWRNVRAAGTASGKRAIAVQFTGPSIVAGGGGLGLSPWPVDGWIGFTCPAIQSDGSAQNLGAGFAALGGIAPGTIVYMLADYDADLMWFKENAGDWNGNAAADPTAGTGGVTPSVSIAGLLPAAQGEGVDAIFTILDWTPPAGFVGW